MRICFGPFILDREARQLWRGQEAIRLSPKAFDLLTSLLQVRPNVIAKEALQKQLWPDTFVAEANLSNLVVEIRHALGDSSRQPHYIRTVHRIGYAFCPESAGDAPAAARVALPCWVQWRTQRFPLALGEHVIGRDPDVEIRIDASTVSRRHARIIVEAERVLLEDFGSKNGTFRGDERVTGNIVLADGDDIRIGSQLISFRVRSGDSTETHAERSR